jgi:Tfp pilus assembly protein FimT
MQWNRGRSLAVGGLFAGGAAALIAVLSALAAPAARVHAAQATVTSHSTAFGAARVTVEARPGGIVCYRVTESTGTARSCRSGIGAGQIGFALSPRGLGGVAGSDVRAVIVKLTRRGTVWATLRDGAFYADVPPAYRVRAVVKVLHDGSRKAFPVRGV